MFSSAVQALIIGVSIGTSSPTLILEVDNLRNAELVVKAYSWHSAVMNLTSTCQWHWTGLEV
jgi:hypothetical protein